MGPEPEVASVLGQKGEIRAGWEGAQQQALRVGGGLGAPRPLRRLPGACLAFPAPAGLPRGQVPAARPSLCVGIPLGEQSGSLQTREAGGELSKPGLPGPELRLLFLFPPIQISSKKACPVIRLIPSWLCLHVKCLHTERRGVGQLGKTGPGPLSGDFRRGLLASSGPPSADRHVPSPQKLTPPPQGREAGPRLPLPALLSSGAGQGQCRSL